MSLTVNLAVTLCLAGIEPTEIVNTKIKVSASQRYEHVIVILSSVTHSTSPAVLPASNAL